MAEGDPLIADRYRLIQRIASGGMADVWVAEDTRLLRTVALKALRVPDPALAARLERESRLLAGLDHPAIVRVYDAGSFDDRPFLVMELVEGQPLHERLHTRGPLEAEAVAAMGAAVAGALAHAHDRGITHRDVKPSNVLVESSGRARLADFGIAQPDGAPHLTATGLAIGTAAYLAPEQLEGGEVGPPADVYSLGLVLIEAVTGRRVFAGPPAEAALARLRRDPHIPPDVPTPIVGLLREMTHRAPEERPAAAAVEAGLAEIGLRRTVPPLIGGSVPTAPEERPDMSSVDLDEISDARSPVLSRRRMAWLGAAAALLVLVGVTAVASAGGSSDRTPESPTVEAPVTTAPPVTSEPVAITPATTAPPPPTEPPEPERDEDEGDPGDGHEGEDDGRSGGGSDDGGGGGEDPQPPPTTDTTVAAPTAVSNST